jgi:hypothetical protein
VLTPTWKKRLIVLGVLVVAAGAAIGLTVWYKFFREVDDGPFASAEERFKYGSIGAEGQAGLPYWIWVALPRVFPDLLPNPAQGGYYSFGLPWEEGREMPVGFTKKTIGFPRVANNCAICHVAQYRKSANETPTIVAAGPNHTLNVQALLRFLTNCAGDPRFSADTLLTEIDKHARLSWLDHLAYRYLLIPRTKQALLARGPQLGWMNRPNWPDWGTGRDDPMNLTKYFMTSMPWDNTIGSADFPSIWNLGLREGKSLNWGGETPSPRSVIIDSALGLQADPKTVVAHAAWIEDFLVKKRAPKYPFPIDAQAAARGKVVFDANCNSCHGLGPGTRVGTVIDIREIGTDDNRLITWTQQAADIANQTVAKLGVQRIGLVKTNGYQAVPLDGVWLRAPFLHNGSVPNLRELLEPVPNRSKVFYRGYDVYDPASAGFDTQSAEAQRLGFKVDISVKGNGNQGHLYGTTLALGDKTALIEYLKTLGPNEGDSQ